MKIRYLSDLHLEFIHINKINEFINNINPGLDEICILAGDIGNVFNDNNHYDIFMNYIDTNFKKTFVITGNHEYYNNNKTIEETNEYLKNYFTKFNNISFLNNTYEIYDNYCFVGTTLWTNINDPNYQINDVQKIPKFDYNKCNQLNKKNIKFLEDTLDNNKNYIIITHHVPSYSLIDEKYKTFAYEHYNQWFYCDMNKFIDNNKNKIKLWVYGHTHTSSYKLIHNIPFVCNPIGYPGENNNCEFRKIKLLN